MLNARKIKVVSEGDNYTFSAGEKVITVSLPFDLIVSQPEKVAAMVQSKLGLNKKIFARNCRVQKIDRSVAGVFLDKWHLMNSAKSAYNYGLFYNDELLAVASFSKGRKLHRLPEDKRSFELIRFCLKEDVSVTGGLTKLVKNFCREKNAGDIMTYVDKQFSDGSSFVKAGFKKHSETAPAYFLIDKKTFERIPVKEPVPEYDARKYFLFRNQGNIKLVYTPVNDKL